MTYYQFSIYHNILLYLFFEILTCQFLIHRLLIQKACSHRNILITTFFINPRFRLLNLNFENETHSSDVIIDDRRHPNNTITTFIHFPYFLENEIIPRAKGQDEIPMNLSKLFRFESETIK